MENKPCASQPSPEAAYRVQLKFMRKLFIFTLSLLGLFDSLYLLWAYTSSSRPMVCVGGGCDVVRASSYAHFAGLPTPVYGVAMYGVLAIISFADPLFSAAIARLAKGLMAAIAAAGFLISVYLTGIEGLIIHAWCAWCLTSAITITLILVLTVIEALHAPTPRGPSLRLAGMQKRLAVLLGGIVLGVPSFVYLIRQDKAPAPPAPPSKEALLAKLVRPDTHIYGNPDSKLTVVEFGDFECPYCGREEKVAREIREKYGSEIRFAFRQYPLNSIHPYAEKAAEASECAAQQGKFWQAVDFLYNHQTNLTVPDLHRYAGDLGLNQQEFDHCLDSGEMAARVERDKDDGRALNVDRVPMFFIGHDMVSGDISFDKFSSIIQKQLAQLNGGTSQAPATAEAKNSSSVKATAKPAASPSPAKSPATSVQAAPMLGQSSSNLFTNLGGGKTGCSEAEAKMKQPTLIGTKAAKALYDQRQQSLFVDVRTLKEYRTEHIRGAMDMPVDQFEKAAKTLPKDKTIILYQSGRSTGDICAASRAAGRILLAQGFSSTHVKVYQPGLAGWQKAGLPVEH